MMDRDSKIYIAGHRGMVGSAIVRRLEAEGFTNLVMRTRTELDLRNQKAVDTFFASEKPDFVFLSAAKVGGIMANDTYRADFIMDNLLIECNVIRAAHNTKVSKLLFLGSSCIYPKFAPQPMTEDAFLTGPLEETNRPYAIAKIAGIEICQSYRDQYGDNFISCMPTNLYGPGDTYDLENSHVLPALIRKFYEAKQGLTKKVQLWGDGSPRREFLYVDDLAEACIFLMHHYDDRQFLNIGTGEDIAIKDLAEMVAAEVGYSGPVEWDNSKPNGTSRKWMDVSRIHALGWKHKTSLNQGIRHALADFVANFS